MPIYEFIVLDDDGADTDETFTVMLKLSEKAKRIKNGRIRHEGKVGRMNWANGMSTCPSNWPMYSDAGGINPAQIPEFMAFDRKHGVPTEYNGDGSPKLNDPRHRKKYFRAHGMHDRNGGYGDP